MDKEDHLKHLEQLESLSGDDSTGLAILKREGAFYFGSYVTPQEYAALYRQKCIELGWIEK